MYSGKHPEVNLLPRQPGLSFLSLSVCLCLLGILNTPRSLYNMPRISCLSRHCSQKIEKAHEEDKSKVFWPIPLLPGTGNTRKAAREDDKNKKEKLNGKKAGPAMPLRYLKLGLLCHQVIPSNAKCQEEQGIR